MFTFSSSPDGGQNGNGNTGHTYRPEGYFLEHLSRKKQLILRNTLYRLEKKNPGKMQNKTELLHMNYEIWYKGVFQYNEFDFE